MDLQLGDVLTMKKNHPCGDKRWLVLGLTSDVKMRCVGCGHEVSLPKVKVEKNIRAIRHPENSST